MIVVILSGFFAAIVLLWLGKYLRGHFSFLVAAIPGGIFLYLLKWLPQVWAGKAILHSYPWITSLGINLDFRLDGLSLFFGLLISGMGVLVFVYAAEYLRGDRHLNRFMSYLLIFMASMLGLVFSDNIILLFVFWELTSISSFFLIAHESKKRRCAEERADGAGHYRRGRVLSPRRTGAHGRHV